jgi:hypothetical protein
MLIKATVAATQRWNSPGLGSLLHHPTGVAVNDSFDQASGSTVQYNAGVMEDADFFKREDALTQSRSSSTYSLY